MSRMRTVSRFPVVRQRGYPISCLRIVAVSATLPNIRDVAQWIGAGPESTFTFDESYRPVKLTTHVVGYEGKSAIDERREPPPHQHRTGRPLSPLFLSLQPQLHPLCTHSHP